MIANVAAQQKAEKDKMLHTHRQDSHAEQQKPDVVGPVAFDAALG